MPQSRTHRFSLHGPTGPALIAAAGAHKAGSPIADLADTAACVYEIAGATVIITRADTTGVAGLELAMPAESAQVVWDRLTEVGQIPSDSDIHDLPDTPAAKIKLRPAGWLAYNTARIEAGTPLFLIDFDTESLPGETGLLDSRVSFTKGCYLGQEIVARMFNLGAPKRRIVALKPGARTCARTRATPASRSAAPRSTRTRAPTGPRSASPSAR